jgi:hypothetical protein
MATEEQKKERLVRIFNNIVFGYAKGLYDMFGDAMLSTVEGIGQDILVDMEHELGLEIQGENPQVILTEIERLLIDEYGLVQAAEIKLGDKSIEVICERCALWKATEDLKEEGVPPYTCVPMGLATAALRRRLGIKARFNSLNQDMDKRICDIKFDLL